MSQLVVITLLIMQVAFVLQDPKQQLNEQLWEAVRKGDAASVTALLDKGADVNAKYRYGTTALFKAAERGNVEVVKILLDRGADVKVTDTFYKATAMTWALQNDHPDVVKLLLDKQPEEAGDVLQTGVSDNKLELVKIALAKGGIKPEDLTIALAGAMDNEKQTEIVDLLKKAGATPPLQVDSTVLQTYVGKYKGDPGPEISFSLKDGKFFAIAPGQPPIALMALSNTNFRPTAFAGLSFTFNSEGDKVIGCAFKQGPNTTQLKRIE